MLQCHNVVMPQNNNVVMPQFNNNAMFLLSMSQRALEENNLHLLFNFPSKGQQLWTTWATAYTC